MIDKYQLVRLAIIYFVFIAIPIIAFVIERLKRGDMKIGYFS